MTEIDKELNLLEIYILYYADVLTNNVLYEIDVQYLASCAFIEFEETGVLILPPSRYSEVKPLSFEEWKYFYKEFLLDDEKPILSANEIIWSIYENLGGDLQNNKYYMSTRGK